MVRPFGVCFLTRYIRKQVRGECEKLLTDQHEKRVERSVAEVLIPVNGRIWEFGDRQIRPGFGDISAHIEYLNKFQLIIYEIGDAHFVFLH
jgi:hypothetical protein